MIEVVIGTRNQSKLREIQEIYQSAPLKWLNLTAFPNSSEVEEDGNSFEENARKKASEYARQTGKWVLAEDSGLCVPALNGQPGIHSARFAGTQGNDQANNQKLLQLMEGFSEEKRVSFYVCCAAVSDPSGVVQVVSEGRCYGRILVDYRGKGGFGYDPLFLIPEYHKTFGELSSTVKHAISHRSRALAHLQSFFGKLGHIGA
ncbi:MAG: RdgB/HAM1 family non-canonical purine NTP pyrophosphatase [Planctomycetia bacterium]